MTAALAHAAPAAAAPCPEPPRAAPAARPRTGGGLRIRVPLRLVVGAQYGDAALSVYIKIAALAMRPELCRAKVAVIAEYLGLSKSAVERALTQLTTAGTDGVAEVLTRRITSRDGDGESAQRWVRPMDDDELFVWLPARAATSMTPRQLRLYAGITYAQVRRIPLALSDLQDLVRHQYGESAGEPLGARQVMRLLDDLETAGWITVHRRQGPRGRHAYEAHLRPLRPVLDDVTDVADEVAVEPTAATAAPTATPDIHDGSAPRTADGSLASEEDTRTDRPLKSAGGSGIRRRRVTVSYRAPVENRPAGPTFHGAGHDEKRSNTSGGTYRGPELQLSPRVWRVLEPVRHHLPDISAYVLRRIGQEVGRQLCAGTGEERLTDRLRLRYATTAEPRDIGRWILGAALVRHGCYLPSCESGFTWTTGAPCPGCYDPGHGDEPALEEPPPARAQQPEPRPPVREPSAWVPWPPPPAPDPEPTPADLDASPDAVRQVLAEHGHAAALRLYGRTRVWALLTADHPEGNPA
ncbi:hypothetical protein [Streptomyces sp. NPDC060198]|uniref:hypothetical protein n=1 Tax=Streptomyces sp. NPDC060198 TaxID=3347070 RepID=UPI003656272E